MTPTDNQNSLHTKDCIWIGSSRDELKKMPDDVKDQVGKALLQAQWGGKAVYCKALRGYPGASMLEIVDDYDTDTYRCIYTVRFGEAIYVLHVFKKKSTVGIKTPKKEMDLVKSRLRLAEDHYKANYSVLPVQPETKKG